MTMEFMSSDKSYVEDDQEILLSKPLPWQSATVAHFKQSLDTAAAKKKSPVARRQMKPRRAGAPSSRPKPFGDFPAWVFKEDYAD